MPFTIMSFSFLELYMETISKGKGKKMGEHAGKEFLDKEIEGIDENIKKLGYQLSELLDTACSFGICVFDPEINNVQEKIQVEEEKKSLFQNLKKHLDFCLKELS